MYEGLELKTSFFSLTLIRFMIQPGNSFWNLSPSDSLAINAAEQLIPVESVQKILNRSRASVYRYTNTDAKILNLPFNAKRLNSELRDDKEASLMFHLNEVARFAQEVL